MALLSYQQVDITGTAQTLSAAVASDTVAPDDRGFVWVKTTGTATNVTITAPAGLDRFGQTFPDIVIACPATGDRLIGPLVRDLADPATGLVSLAFSGTLSGVTRAAVRI